jgi:hypothetical protein
MSAACPSPDDDPDATTVGPLLDALGALGRVDLETFPELSDGVYTAACHVRTLLELLGVEFPKDSTQ